MRYGRMLVSPSTFYRGAAPIMATDLATTPSSGLTVQLCGDAHLSNFGVYTSPERQMLFDIKDFDETLPGPWEWDVKRLAASFEIVGRENGFSPADRRSTPPLIVLIEDLVLGEKARAKTEAATQSLLRSYRRTLRQPHYDPQELFLTMTGMTEIPYSYRQRKRRRPCSRLSWAGAGIPSMVSALSPSASDAGGE